MKLTSYKLKISFFIIGVIFFMIFSTGLGFLYYRETKTEKYINYTLNKSKKYIKSLDALNFQTLVISLDNLYISNMIGDVISNKDFNVNKIIRHLIGVDYIDLRKNNGEIIFQNFDISYCDINFLCKQIKRGGYIITIGEKINNNFISKYNVLLFGILSFFISILFFPLIYYIVSRITKPIEKNFEFMKNFVNNAGHELKTPIANINLSAQILKQKNQYDEEIINDMIGESSKLSQIIDTLLQLSLLSKFENKEKVNLKEIIENILNEYKQEFEKNNIKLETELEDSYKNININQFKILFRNLLSNAIKYNNEKGVIKIYLDKNKLIVTNTGKEIDSKHRKKIFDLFYRIQQEKNGYGLGLALVKKIVDINKWKIKVKSINGENAFIVEF